MKFLILGLAAGSSRRKSLSEDLLNRIPKDSHHNQKLDYLLVRPLLHFLQIHVDIMQTYAGKNITGIDVEECWVSGLITRLMDNQEFELYVYCDYDNFALSWCYTNKAGYI